MINAHMAKTKNFNYTQEDHSGNPFNNIFYSNLGFKKLGEIYFRKQSDKPFYCFEKVI